MSGRLMAVAGVAFAVVALVPACSDGEDSNADTSAPTTQEKAEDDTDDAAGTDGADAPSGTASSEDDATGSIDQPEANEEPGQVLDPVALDAVGDFGTGVTVRVVTTEAIEAEAEVPGELSGPAVAVTIEMENTTQEPVDLSLLAVDLYTVSGTPVARVTIDPEGPLAGTLAPASTAIGRYAFTIDAVDRDEVTLFVKYSGEAPAVIFTGDLPR